MTSAAVETRGLRRAPRLRLLPAHQGLRTRRRATASEIRDAETRPALRLLNPPAEERPVLIAGGDAAAREAVRRDLARTISPETAIEQAGAVWEVLARAADSSIVILSGALEGLSAESLLSMLAQRHPGLPVVSVGNAAAATPVPVAC
ncbi:MAG TPA: hypothetical protein VL988_11380 [Solirubrobacteraceae bacterium]|nr:hypothetical protein [Solirubrobacteraceae bacterium]